MGKSRELTGQRFGKLIALSRADSVGSKARWLCRCDCGVELAIVTGSLVSGNTKSCGCYKVEAVVEKNTTHGMSRTPIYRTWQSMVNRCTNENYAEYHRYGERGITVCDEWISSFENFYAHVGDKPKGMTLDRIDNDKGYAPGNVRWASYSDQMNNKSTNNVLTLKDGREVTTKEASIIFGINYQTLQTRVHAGWTLRETLSPSRPLARAIFAEVIRGDKSSDQIAEMFNVPSLLVDEFK